MGGIEEFRTIHMSTLYSLMFHRQMMKNKITLRWNKRERDCFSAGAWGQAWKQKTPGPVSRRDAMRSEYTRRRDGEPWEREKKKMGDGVEKRTCLTKSNG